MSTHKELKEIISPCITMENGEGKGGDAYEKSLEQLPGVTIETVKSIQHHNRNFMLAAAEASAEKVHGDMKKNKTMKEGGTEFKMGDDTLMVNHKRSFEQKNNFAKEGEPDTKTIPGKTTIKHKSYAFDKQKGGAKELKKVQDTITALFEDLQ